MDTIEFQKYEQVARDLTYNKVVDITHTVTEYNIHQILKQFNDSNILGVAQYTQNTKWMYSNPGKSINVDQQSILVLMKSYIVFIPRGISVESIKRTLANYKSTDANTDVCHICLSDNKGVNIMCNQCSKSFCAACHVRLVIHGIRDHADTVITCPFCRFMDESYRMALQDANQRDSLPRRYTVYDMVRNVVHNVIQYIRTGVMTRDTAESLCDYAVRELIL